MGLSVVHGIVKSHGGAIGLTERMEQGTEFHVHLPRIESVGGHSVRIYADVEEGDESILLVDDDPAVAEVLRRYLEVCGYDVAVFTDSLEAFEAFSERPEAFSLLVTDFSMPGWTGAELARAVQAVAPRMPIVIVSGHGELIDRQELGDLRNPELLAKPVHFGDFTRTVRRALDEAIQADPR